MQSHALIFAPRKVKAANRRLIVVVLGVVSPLYHGKFIQFFLNDFGGELDKRLEKLRRAAAPPKKQILPGQIPFGFRVENGQLITGKPMTKASEELLEYLPHIVNKRLVCRNCKDKSFCNQCAFFGPRKKVSNLMMKVCEEN